MEGLSNYETLNHPDLTTKCQRNFQLGSTGETKSFIATNILSSKINPKELRQHYAHKKII